MINIVGSIFGTSGYAKHTRYLANAINKLEPVRLMTNAFPGWESQVNDKELEMIKRTMKEDYDTNLIITHPLHWRGNLTAKFNIVYLVWEGDKLPLYILEECYNENVNKIIVPSEHTYIALKQSISDYDERTYGEIINKVVIISHGVDLEVFKPVSILQTQDITKQAKPFRFLANKGFRNLEDRGGIQYLVKAFVEEFTDQDKVELVLKLNPAYGIPDLEPILSQIINRKVNLPKITIIPVELSEIEMVELYNQCDIFVSPTRAEAFNLPCLEALACGKLVITTGYGGQTDYCTGETGWLIDYDLTEVEHDIEYEGIKWATPKIASLRESMRKAYSLASVGLDNAACRPKAEKYSWDNTAKKIIELKNTLI